MSCCMQLKRELSCRVALGNRMKVERCTCVGIFTFLDNSLEDNLSEGSNEDKGRATPFGQFQLNHLGPVTRRDRIYNYLERVTPYLTPVLLISLVFLLPIVLATLTKVRNVSILICRSRSKRRNNIVDPE